jgi:hypothetical protein
MVRDLLRRETPPLAKKQCVALPLGKRLERVVKAGEELSVVVITLRARDQLEATLAVERTACCRALLPAADVPCDRVQPRRFAVGNDAAAERLERVEEGDLDRVLGFRARAETLQAVREKPLGVLAVEPLGLGVVRRSRMASRCRK